MTKEMGKAGKYDAVSAKVLVELGASAVMVAVIGGPMGHGFSVSCLEPINDALQAELPRLLRAIADRIDSGGKPTGVRIMSPDGSPVS